MDTKNFVSRLKAHGMENDVIDLEKTYTQYKDLSNNLSTNDRSPFSLNVLCTICRNIERVPSWGSLINDKYLLLLTIECARETRVVEVDQSKTLAYIYHIHRHVIRKNAKVPPEFVLKLSYMPFEKKNLLKEYYKTYWSIIADRITYIEKLKTKTCVNKLLSSLAEDILKIIHIFDPIQFCTTVLSYIIKKLYVIFSDTSKELNIIYQKIFESIPKTDINNFKQLSDKDAMDIYIKLNDCLCVITENVSKMNFKDSYLENSVRTCIFLLGHKKDILYCFQTFYLNSFCNIVKDNSNTDVVFNSLVELCESTEKIGYKKAIYATYPFLSQLIKVYIESGKFKESISAAKPCLEFIIFLIEKLKYTTQLLKCEGCNVKSGLHDGLRLSFLTKLYITVSNDTNYLTLILPIFYTIVEKQYDILNELKRLGCPNYEKCFKKLQAGVHNTAISLHSAKLCEFSVKLFNIYLEYELKGPYIDLDKKSISRALYNKGISELELDLLEEATKSAYLSIIFALPESLSMVKYMDLVNNIKSTTLKSKFGDDDKMDKLRYMSCLDACKLLLNDNRYDILKPFIEDVKFCKLLHYEHKMYMEYWPSVKPIAGVCKSLNYLLNNYENTTDRVEWLANESKELILETLYEVILNVTKIRTINIDIFQDVTVQLLQRFEKKPPTSMNHRLIYATLMFLKSEHDICDMADKHQWRVSEHTNILDPDKDETHRNLELEHAAVEYALRGVDYMTTLLPDLSKSSGALPPSWHTALHVSQTLVQELLYMNRTVYALQLALICCHMAKMSNYGAGYVRNAGVIVYHASRRNEFVDKLVRDGREFLGQLVRDKRTLGVALGFTCEVAIYYSRVGAPGVAARLVQFVQAKVLHFYQTAEKKDHKVEMAVGRLMEAQQLLCASSENVPSELTAVTTLHRHYLAAQPDGNGWSTRRRNSQALRARSSAAGVRCCVRARSLQLWRRARAAAAAALPVGDARTAARLHAALTHTHAPTTAQMKIDNRLRFVAGQQPSSIIPEGAQVFEYTPQVQVHDTMLLCICGVSPTVPTRTVSAHQVQDFLQHTSCACYACDTPSCTMLTCEIDSLEASMYYRANEFEIARNYYNGALKTFALADKKLKDIIIHYKRKYNGDVCDIVNDWYVKELKNIELEFLIELSYFELSQKLFDKANEVIIRIHELMTEHNYDKYVTNEVYNLMITAAKLKENRKIKRHSETEFEDFIIPNDVKTPNSKVIPNIEKNFQEDIDELPKRLKVIKINLDDADDDDETENIESKRPGFKVPLLKQPKVEKMTPKLTRNKLKQQLYEADTPKTPNLQFFTPTQSTPSEKFFTPMSSMKTYSRQIVKNLENEFLTPHADKLSQNYMRETARKRSKVEGPLSSGRNEKDKKTLLRATSPGKSEDRPQTRSRRRADNK